MDIVAEDDKVAGRFKCPGTHRGEFLGVAPTGKRVEVAKVFCMRVEDGKLMALWALDSSR